MATKDDTGSAVRHIEHLSVKLINVSVCQTERWRPLSSSFSSNNAIPLLSSTLKFKCPSSLTVAVTASTKAALINKHNATVTMCVLCGDKHL